ncbi:MAG TPA: S8 family serine peptidase [Coleofasciculaceae cyanobacterium]
MLPATNALAAISPQSAAVIKIPKSVMDSKKYDKITGSEWNDILVGLMVTDDTLEKDFHAYRMRILRDAPQNPDIPLGVVHAAIYSAGVFGEKVSEAAFKNEIADALEPYSRNVITDTVTTDEKGTKINKKRVFSASGSGNGDFREFAEAAIGRVSAPETVAKLSEKLLYAGKNPERTSSPMAGLERLSGGIDLSRDVSTRMAEMIYGESARKNVSGTYAKLMELVNAAKEQGYSILIPPKEYEAKVAGDKSDEIEKVCGAPSDALKKLNAKWLKPKLQCFDGNEATLLQAAQATKILSQREAKAGSTWKLDSTLPAIAQHFARKDYTQGPNTLAFEEVDWLNAWALAFHAQSQNPAHAKQARQLMKMVVASYPKAMASLISAGLHNPSDDVLSKAGREWINALSADMVTYRELVDALISKKAELLWQEPKDQSLQSEFSDLRDVGRELGVVLLLGDPQGLVNKTNPGKSKIAILRKIAGDNDDKMQKVAYVALATARDKESLGLFLETAADPTADKELRQLAMEAVQFMLTDPLIPEELVRRALAQRPIQFQLTGVNEIFKSVETPPEDGSTQKKTIGTLDINLKQDEKTGLWHFATDPFHSRAMARYKTWETQTNRLIASGNKGGRVNLPLTEPEKLMKFIAIYSQELGADGQQNRTLLRDFIAKDPQRAKTLMEPMLDYLRDSGQNIELEMAIPMMTLLREAAYAPAAPVLAKMMKNPDQFAPKIDNSSFFSLLDAATAPVLIRYHATQALGGMVDPTSAEARQLHDILHDPFLPMQVAGVDALGRVGDRLKAQLQTASGSEKGKLETALNTHIQALSDNIRRHQKGFYEGTQSRIFQERVIGLHARAIARLSPQVAEKIAQQAKTENNLPLLRAMANAILTENFTPDTLGDARKNPLLAEFTDRKYWLGDLADGPERLAATGQSLHFDAGLVQPIGPLKGKVVYPEDTNFGNPAHYLEPHPTGTAASKIAVAPNLQILSHSVWNNDKPQDTGRPEVWESAFLKALEAAIQNQMTGKTHAQSSNTSMGFMNAALYSEDFRQNLADVIASAYETLGRTGVLNFLAAGNEQGGGPTAEFGRIGSTSTLGVRLDKDRNARQPDSTVMVSAIDGFAKLLAEFSSTGNPVRKEDAIRMVGAPGVQDQTLYRDNDNRWRSLPVDGTSFASPHMEALFRIAQAAREKRGLPSLSEAEIQKKITQASEPIEGRESWEGGDYVNPLKLLAEFMTP